MEKLEKGDLIIRILNRCLFCPFLSLIFLSIPLYAEIYQNIGPSDNLSDIKNKFPSAVFERLYPAWAHEKDVMYSITGEGIAGRIIVIFEDSRPICKKILKEGPVDKELKDKLFVNKDSISNKLFRSSFKYDDDEALKNVCKEILKKTDYDVTVLSVVGYPILQSR